MCLSLELLISSQGAFTDRLTWRWCFYINLPLGAVTLVAVALLVKLPSPSQPSSFREHLRHLDLAGTAIFIPGVTSLLLALQWGGTTYDWSNWRIVLLFCVFGVASIVWAVLQRRLGDRATLPPRIASQRSIWVGLCHIAVVGGATFVIAYFVPIWFQAVKDYAPQDSGVNYLSVSIPGALFAVASGVLVRISMSLPCSPHLADVGRPPKSDTTCPRCTSGRCSLPSEQDSSKGWKRTPRPGSGRNSPLLSESPTSSRSANAVPGSLL